jgi:RNA-directed DNA polymerase
MGPDRPSGVSCGHSQGFQARKASTMWSGQEELDLVSASTDSQPIQWALHWEAGVKPQGPGARVDARAARETTERPMCGESVMEEVLERHNRQTALRQVRANQGSPGIDAISVEVLPDFLRTHGPGITHQLLEGTYQPRVITRVEIPKPGSQEKRTLGIPCVLDRLIQPALLQGLQWRWDPTCSESSDGFRPGRNAHQAVAPAQASMAQGFSMVVARDVEKCFDQVWHDRLMRRLAQRIADKRVLKLIRAYLHAGMLENGLITVPEAGTPQGSPLSPFLSHGVLDALDKELERRGHRCCRYADARHSYVRSRRAGERVMASITRFLTHRLKRKVHAQKSAVACPQNRRFLGCSFPGGKSPGRRQVAPKALDRFTARVTALTQRHQGRSLPHVITTLNQYLQGWKGSFGFCQPPTVLRDGDSWIRHRLRCLPWKHWKGYRRRKAALIKRGVDPFLAHMTAWSGKGPGAISHTPGVRIALDNRVFDQMGLIRLYTPHRMSPYRTAMVRTRRPGGVGGGSREASPYPD